MKKSIIIILSFFTLISNAQKKLPILQATSSKSFIKEENEEKRIWYLDSKAKPDIYTLNKSVKPKLVIFHTDIDSLKVKLKPGEKFNFIVLLNKKDSCLIQFQAPIIKDYSKSKIQIHDTIPFVLSPYNNIIFKVVLNQKDTLNLKFDSGTTDFLLTNDAIKKLKLENLSKHTFQLGNHLFSNQQIYPVTLSGQGTEGRFGWNLFDGKIVEIDYDKNIFIIHTHLSKITKDFQKLPIEYTHTLFCIQGELQLKEKKYKSKFLFDNGYQRTIMLDENLMKEQNYPKEKLSIIKKVIMKNGEGKEIPVLTVNNDQLNLGNYSLMNIPVQLLTTANPARFTTHILGNEVLKRFNTILDFQDNVVYLKPNSLWNERYTEGI